MLSTDGSYTITAEGNSSKCLLVLHKPKVGTKIGWQTGESSGALWAPLRFTAAGNADRKPFFGSHVQFSWVQPFMKHLKKG